MSKDIYEQITSYSKLSNRQKSIIDMLIDGMRPAYIQKELQITPIQYKGSVSCIYKVLDIHGPRNFAEQKIKKLENIRDTYKGYIEEKYDKNTCESLVYELNGFENEVVQLLKEGKTESEISQETRRTEQYIYSVISSIYRKLELKSSRGDKERRNLVIKIYNKAKEK